MAVNDQDVMRVSLRIRLPSLVEAFNIFDLRSENATPVADGGAVADVAEYIGALIDAFKARVKTTVTFYDLRIVIPERQYEVGTWLLAVPGTSSSDLLPHGVSTLVLGLTDNIKIRGRKYLPGCTEGSIGADGFWNSTHLSAAAVYAAAWTDEFVAATANVYTPGVVSKATPDFHPFTNYRTTEVPAYQRRRRPDFT
jgi:hypothetical protein